MANEVDISETELLLKYEKKDGTNVVVMNMLKDHTTQDNIYWATDSYANIGKEGYTFYDPITIEKITGENDMIIRPRAVKSKEEQTQRAKDKAEVFTPSWICNAQNNLIDEQWFGRKDVFNHEDPENPQQWIDTEGKIEFPNTEGKTWIDYVADIRLEITCGEAPYLVSRYDTVSGDPIDDVRHRIGLIDRKLRVVSENCETSADWIKWAKVALAASYGFEWQGDNLLLAREAIFYSFIDHYKAKFGKVPTKTIMEGVSYIVSWNIWQMDGLTYGLPGYTVKERDVPKRPEPVQLSLDFGAVEEPEPEPEEVLSHERLCRIKDFFKGINLHNGTFNTNFLRSKNDNDKEKFPTFKSFVNNK